MRKIKALLVSSLLLVSFAHAEVPPPSPTPVPDPSPSPTPVPTTTVDPMRSTVVASTVTENVNHPITVTVTLLDSNGLPVPGISVSLSSTQGTSDTIFPTTEAQDFAGNAVSAADGTATFFVTSPMVGMDTFQAYDVTDNLAIMNTATVSFVTPYTMDPQTSTVVASPTMVPVGTSSTVTVTLLDSTGMNPIPGEPVQLFSSNSTVDTIVPNALDYDANGNPLTDSNGTVTFTVSSPMESSNYQAIDMGVGLVPSQYAVVFFQGGAGVAAAPAKCTGANGAYTLTSVSAFSATKAFGVGGSTICAWDGTSWTLDPLHNKFDGFLNSVWMDMDGQSEGWAVGHKNKNGNGTVLHYLAGAWSEVSDNMGVQIKSDLRAVHGVDATHVWIAGNQGIYFWNGVSWTAQLGGGAKDYDMYTIWAASKTEAWAGGLKGAWRLAGGKWASINVKALPYIWSTAYGTSNQDVYLGGDRDKGLGTAAMTTYDGTGWTAIANTIAELSGANAGQITGLYRASNTDPVYASWWQVKNIKTGIATYSGGKWSAETIPAGAKILYRIWGTSKTNIWAVGGDAKGGALILNYDGTKWSQQN